jgi:hypothetical protein
MASDNSILMLYWGMFAVGGALRISYSMMSVFLLVMSLVTRHDGLLDVAMSNFFATSVSWYCAVTFVDRSIAPRMMIKHGVSAPMFVACDFLLHVVPLVFVMRTIAVRSVNVHNVGLHSLTLNLLWGATASAAGGRIPSFHLVDVYVPMTSLQWCAAWSITVMAHLAFILACNLCVS